MANTEVAEPAPLLSCENLAVHYRAGGELVRAVDGVSLSIGAGETLGLVGESGSGKSTLGRALVGLTSPASGTIRFRGRDVATSDPKELRRRIAMVFQNPYAALNPRMTVQAILADPLRVHELGTAATRRRRVAEMLELVGLDPALATRFPHQFSGGQRQRLGIARALMLEPDLIVCDEPVSALDVSIQAQILNLLQELQQRLGIGMLLISHDLAVIRQLANRIAVMYFGRIVETGGCEDIYERVGHPYTRALLDSVHVPDPQAERARHRELLSGEIPNPATPPAGCRFHSRCPLRRQLGEPPDCVEREPALGAATATHRVACHFPVPAAAAN